MAENMMNINERKFVTHTEVIGLRFHNYLGGNELVVTGITCVDIRTRNGPGLKIQDWSYQLTSGETQVAFCIPDPNRVEDNREDFVWCVPVDRVTFNKWVGLADKFRGMVPKEHGGGVRHMNRFEKGKVRTIILMPNGSQSDDDVRAAAAYLRLVEKIDCRMYVVRCGDDPLKGARLMHAAAGADPTQLLHIEEGEERGDADAEGD